MEYEDEYYLEEDKLGMTITAGSVTLSKNESNLIGISIGGGGKYCPCLYVVQVFDNTAASRDSTLQSGDEITGVNSINVKGKSKTEVAQLIQRSQDSVTIHYNKLHPDLKQGKSLDIILKKVKHQLVEGMSSSTADAFGLSRAILCNDALVKKLDDLTKAEEMYRALIDHAKLVFKAFFDLIQVYKKFGDVFCGIGVREIQQSANEAFNQFGEAHRQMEKYGIQMLKRLKPILGDLGTYLYKAIPDTRLTIKRYADIKFEYLSYCLKVKEMDDEEIQFAQLQEPLYRVETGNYEYRLILRCRQDARSAFARLRSDVLVKLELLDSKHVQHLTAQLTRLVSILSEYHLQCERLMHGKHWFPIELDLAGTTLYGRDCGGDYHGDEEEEEEEDETNDDVDDSLLDAEEARESNSALSKSGVDHSAASAASGEGDWANHPLGPNEQLLGQLQGLGLVDDDIVNFGGDYSGVMNVMGVGMSACGVMNDGVVESGWNGESVMAAASGANVASVNTTSMQRQQQLVNDPFGHTLMSNSSQSLNMMSTSSSTTMASGHKPLQSSGLVSLLESEQGKEVYVSGINSPTNPLESQQPSVSASVSESTGDTIGKKAVHPEVSSSTAGLSQLSQELLAEPSVDKQLEAFMSPNRKPVQCVGAAGSSTGFDNGLQADSSNVPVKGLDDVLLGTAGDKSILPSDLELFMAGGSSSVAPQGKTTSTSGGSQGSSTRKEAAVTGNMEDVNLLDGF